MWIQACSYAGTALGKHHAERKQQVAGSITSQLLLSLVASKPVVVNLSVIAGQMTLHRSLLSSLEKTDF